MDQPETSELEEDTKKNIVLIETTPKVEVEDQKAEETPEVPEPTADEEEEQKDVEGGDSVVKDGEEAEEAEEDNDDDTNKAEDEEDEDDDDDVKVTIEDTVPDYNLRAKQRPPQQAKPAAIDLEAGQAILDVDLSTLEDKPWRRPGADISDYFNYGFDEDTWKLYCEKQKKMKAVANELNSPETYKIPTVPPNEHSKYSGPMKIPTIVSNEPRFTHGWIPPVAPEPDDERERERERDRHREREKTTRDREKEKERDRDPREKERDREKTRDREKEREREKARDRDHTRERDKNRDRDKARERERSHRESGKKRERDRSRERERDKKRKRSR